MAERLDPFVVAAGHPRIAVGVLIRPQRAPENGSPDMATDRSLLDLLGHQRLRRDSAGQSTRSRSIR
jgi:hypothetical protein